MRNVEDRGLHAVERVREVRERDSRLGLLQADREHREALARAAEMDGLVHSHASALAAPGAPVAAGEWAARRVVVGAVAASARTLRAEADMAAIVRTAANEHWQRDRSRLRAVEKLLEHRAELRLVEAARTEAKLLDDVAGQRWLRHQRADEVDR